MQNHKFKQAMIPAALLSLGFAFTAIGQGTPAAAPAKGSTSGQLADADRTFVEKAAKGGMAEVEMGKVAQQKASDAKVKQFAERMVTDHSKANEELKSIAGKKGMTLPASPDKAHQDHAQKLQGLKGTEFDQEYMKHMVADHTKTVADFDKKAKSGKDSDVKQFASKNLPTIREHLKMAQQIEQSAKRSKGASGK